MTRVSGSHAPSEICSRKLIFSENFDKLDESKWQHERTLGGGGNGEFQWYVKSRDSSFTKNGILHIKPRLTSDYYGEDFLSKGEITIPELECTNPDNDGCKRFGTRDNILNPVRSARIRTMKSFSFKFGTLVTRAKMPAGDWLWPAIWLMPTKSVYCSWPRSGEIDLAESRGNLKLFSDDGVNIGAEQFGSTLHFGPRYDFNGWSKAHFEKNSDPGYNDDFHIYKLVWTPDYLDFYIDGERVGKVDTKISFWERGAFNSSGLPNPWLGRLPVAPFDQEFYIIINLAVGGIKGYFPDGLRNDNGDKPWKNWSPSAMNDFWNGRNDWLPTRNYKKNDDADLQVDYVRVWAL